MPNSTMIISYLIIYRVSVTVAAIICIVLGYKLFSNKAYIPTNQSGQDLEAEFQGFKFSMKNGAPGTCFALFGAALMALMIFHMPPEVTKDLLEDGSERYSFKGLPNASETINDNERDSLRKSDDYDIMAKNRRGNKKGARQDAIKLIHSFAGSLNNLAWVLYEGGFTEDLDLALSLSNIAVWAEPNNSEFTDTRDRILRNYE